MPHFVAQKISNNRKYYLFATFWIFVSSRP